MLLNVLPKEGDFLTIKIIRTLREDLGFTEQELKDNNMTDNKGAVSWDEKGYAKDITIGERATDVIVAALKSLNDQKKLTQNHFDLYERFVGE
jgi:hypothetical protein